MKKLLLLLLFVPFVLFSCDSFFQSINQYKDGEPESGTPIDFVSAKIK